MGRNKVKEKKNHFFAFIVPFCQIVTHFTQFIIIRRLGTIFSNIYLRIEIQNNQRNCLVFLLNINWLEKFFASSHSKLRRLMTNILFKKTMLIMWLLWTSFIDICEKFQYLSKPEHFQCTGMYANNRTFSFFSFPLHSIF